MRPLCTFRLVPATILTGLAWLALLLVFWAGPVVAAVESTFDAGTEGWRVTGDNAFSWNATGGNPGGCLAVNDLSTGAHNYAVAPLAYLGNWGAMTGADTLRADFYLRNLSGGAVLDHAYTFRIAGPGGAARALSGPAYVPPYQVWTRYAVSLDAADWTLESGSWPALLASVQSLTLEGEYINGDEDTRIDNVRLSATPETVFEPCVYNDFNTTGLGEWSFSGTGGTSNPGSGGNTRGFCQINESSSETAYAFAPPAFLGDWSSLDGSGRVTIDIRVLSYAGTNVGAPEFIRLSGPGGTAHVSLAPGEVPTAPRVWKSFSFPLVSGHWTVTAGSWSGLLAQVAECRVRMEFFDGSEQVGFDNFGRLAGTCWPIDMPVAVVAPDITGCGYRSFVGLSGLARNPRNDELYGLVRAATSSGGGLWAVSGPGVGARLQAYDQPAHLLCDAEGNIFISEDYSGNIYRYAWGSGSSL